MAGRGSRGSVDALNRRFDTGTGCRMSNFPRSAGSPQPSRAFHSSTPVLGVEEPKQIPLALDYAPPQVREHGLRDAHWAPLASWGKGRASFRTTPQCAWQLPLLEMDRTGNSYAAIGLDVDGRDNVICFMDAVLNRRLLEPNIIVERRASGNIQAHYCLARPVHRGPGARQRPISALVRISEYFVESAQADHGFTGVLSRNPMEAAHLDPQARDGPCRTIWGRREPYTLAELTTIVPLGWKRPVVAVSVIGRNETLFRTLMRETGKPSNWGRPVLPLALAVADGIRRTMGGNHPFTTAEVHDTAASVERYQRPQPRDGSHASGSLGAPGGPWAQVRGGPPAGQHRGGCAVEGGRRVAGDVVPAPGSGQATRAIDRIADFLTGVGSLPVSSELHFCSGETRTKTVSTGVWGVCPPHACERSELRSAGCGGGRATGDGQRALAVPLAVPLQPLPHHQQYLHGRPQHSVCDSDRLKPQRREDRDDADALYPQRAVEPAAGDELCTLGVGIAGGGHEYPCSYGGSDEPEQTGGDSEEERSLESKHPPHI